MKDDATSALAKTFILERLCSFAIDEEIIRECGNCFHRWLVFCLCFVCLSLCLPRDDKHI
jgi:hypothetical protein